MLCQGGSWRRNKTLEDKCKRESEKMTRIKGDDTDMPSSS